MTRLLLILSIVSLLLFTGCDSENTTEPEQISGTVLSFFPEDLSSPTGEQIPLQLVMQNLADSVFAVTAQISYSDSVLLFSGMADASNGELFGSDAIQFVQDTLSVLHITISRIQGQAEVTGSGTICTLQFIISGSGSSTLELLPDQLIFFDSVGREIEIPDLEIRTAIVRVN